MKILAIRGKNLASLEEEFDIDFTTEPLKSAGIFAITGNTGAGKSTILDALCLALFDDIPRLKEAETTININDVEDKTITQKDSRNILRRGTAEGYAEVDFVALNGETYRSRWMVRRARDKISGALQATTIKLKNLTNSFEEQGTKTDLLNKIKEVIGLDFSQFTRAVLLAQGEFANFLKARQDQKAELLEKLTGTEIYAKISVSVFQKTAETKKEYELLLQQLNGITLLNEEEITAYNNEKTTLQTENKKLKEEQNNIEKKLAWFKQQDVILLDIDNARDALSTVQTQIKEAYPRFEYMTMLETSQEIRDTYFTWQNKQKQYGTLSEALTTKKNEEETIEKQVKTAGQTLSDIKLKYEDNENTHKKLKPELDEAQKLDIKIQSIQEKETDAQKELDIQTGLKQKTETEISGIEVQIDELKKNITEIHQWFAQKEEYSTVVAKTDLYLSYLDEAQSAKKQIHLCTGNLASEKELLDIYSKKLNELKEKSEQLNKLLPFEVAELRSKLEDGKPCPVCGSVHHPYNAIKQEINIDAKELDSQKEQAAAEIKDVTEKTEQKNKKITELEVLLNTYNTQYDTAITKASGYLQLVPDWENKLEHGEMQSRLSDFAKKWKEYEKKLNEQTQSLNNLTAKIESEKKSYKNINSEFLRKKDMYDKLGVELRTISEERKKLLNGLSVDEVYADYNKLKEEYTRTKDENEKIKNKLEKQKAEIKGIVAQIEQDSVSLHQQISDLDKEIKEWISYGKHHITYDRLKELMQKSREWINTEKEELDDLRKKELVAKTTLQERQNKLTIHLSLANKPQEENKEQLDAKAVETNDKIENVNKQLTGIEVVLSRHNDNKKLTDKIGKELSQKKETYDNWAKLNDLLGSPQGLKFKKIAQGYTLDVLLDYANMHLYTLTQRYKLEKIPDSLALQIIDNDQLGEVRSIHTLSGGESFLISLSLALGLSSLSSNRMKIESLFIDEGFGSLDLDTLNVVMDALENLQAQGRKIGVISHIEEMKERISTQIQVLKTTNGKSHIRIVG